MVHRGRYIHELDIFNSRNFDFCSSFLFFPHFVLFFLPNFLWIKKIRGQGFSFSIVPQRTDGG
ncbi:hypothetical protein EHR08_18435 [Leptospira bandrabouensis]|uniref:Uncharacterized protein n=1 Tax=Leptospira bandrabouensis TaxID=2484903 RepID=A0A6H3NQV6_9LEPT|nr:hypothetical protein EHR07_03310 [Leptospira bandrabouensis]TGN11486.1 hypothetical protein EHR08_18435 [Leptospira bandrabouensis]